MKRFAWLTLVLALLVSLAACSGDAPQMDDTQVQDQTQTDADAQQPQEGEQVITEEEQQIVDQIIADSEAVMGGPPAADEYAWETREGVQQADGILVKCAVYDLLLPSSWEGHYTVEETDNWLSLYCTDDMLEDYGGLLCTIGWTTEEMDYIGMPGYIMLGQITMDGVTYDVVADVMEVAEDDASELYLSMKADIIDVLGTLAFHENVEFVPAE